MAWLWHRHLAGVVHNLAIEDSLQVPCWVSLVCIRLQPATGHMPATPLRFIDWISIGADRPSGSIRLQTVRSLETKRVIM